MRIRLGMSDPENHAGLGSALFLVLTNALYLTRRIGLIGIRRDFNVVDPRQSLNLTADRLSVIFDKLVSHAVIEPSRVVDIAGINMGPKGRRQNLAACQGGSPLFDLGRGVSFTYSCLSASRGTGRLAQHIDWTVVVAMERRFLCQ